MAVIEPKVKPVIPDDVTLFAVAAERSVFVNVAVKERPSAPTERAAVGVAAII